MNGFCAEKSTLGSFLMIMFVLFISGCHTKTTDPITPTLPKPFTPTATTTATETHTVTPEPTSTTTPTISTPSLGKADIRVDFTNSIGHSPEAFGLNGWWTDEDAEIWQQRYAELNPQVVRVPVLHSVIEPDNDNNEPISINWDRFHFDTPYSVGDNRHITYRKWFSTLLDADITIMVYIPYLASWLSTAENPPIASAPYPPNDLSEYEELIRALLQYLIYEIGYAPDKIILEPVNEPDLLCGADADVSCFWQYLDVNELAAVLESASKIANEMDPQIRIAGPTLCCQGDVLNRLMTQHNAANYLDIITFHSYEQGNSGLNLTFNRVSQTSSFGKPVYLNEYGNRGYWSNGKEGALWHSVALGEFWKAGVSPIQFSMAEVPWMHTGYNELGLFRSWQAGWEIKPAYWVYANFFTNLQNMNLVSLSSPIEMPVIAGKADEQHLAIWVTNINFAKDEDILIQVDNWVSPTAHLQILENLSGTSPIEDFNISVTADESITFAYPISPQQSLLFLLSAAENQ